MFPDRLIVCSFSLATLISHGRRRDGNQRMNERARDVADQAVISRPRYFADFPVGKVFESSGSITVTEQDIIAFARQFDPQAMHTDPCPRGKGSDQRVDRQRLAYRCS